MRSRIKGLLLFVFAVVFAVSAVGCSKQAGPTDADAIKAIQATLEGNTAGYVLKSPIVIVEKAKPLSGADWSVKAEYTVADKEGKDKKESLAYKLSPAVNDMGANYWIAMEIK